MDHLATPFPFSEGGCEVSGHDKEDRVKSQNRTRSLKPSRWFFASWTVLVVALIAEGLRPGFSEQNRAVPFLVSVIVFGLPHGAADLMLLRTHLRRRKRGLLAWRFGVYLLIMSISAALILSAPVWSLLGFLLLSAWHFGVSDIHDLRLLGFRETSPVRLRLRALSRGFLIVSLPLALSPVESAGVANQFLSLLGQSGIGATLPEEPLLAARGIGILALTGSFGLLLYRIRQGKKVQGTIEAGETVLLVLVLGLLDPLFAIGLYFVSCHSLRHVVKLMKVWDPDGVLPPWRLLVKVYIKSAPLLIPTIVVLVVLAATLASWDGDRIVVMILAVFAITTLSHHVLVDDVLGLEEI